MATLQELLHQINALQDFQQRPEEFPSQAELMTKVPAASGLEGVADIIGGLAAFRNARRQKEQRNAEVANLAAIQKRLFELQHPQSTPQQPPVFGPQEEPKLAEGGAVVPAGRTGIAGIVDELTQPPAQAPVEQTESAAVAPKHPLLHAIGKGLRSVFVPKPSAATQAVEDFTKQVEGLTPEQLSNPAIRSYLEERAGLPDTMLAMRRGQLQPTIQDAQLDQSYTEKVLRGETPTSEETLAHAKLTGKTGAGQAFGAALRQQQMKGTQEYRTAMENLRQRNRLEILGVQNDSRQFSRDANERRLWAQGLLHGFRAFVQKGNPLTGGNWENKQEAVDFYGIDPKALENAEAIEAASVKTTPAPASAPSQAPAQAPATAPAPASSMLKKKLGLFERPVN